jgi:undecaprenyl diphosphate synthase
MKSPNHIAIIMDGNGRWGLKKYNNRLIGHHYGIKNIKNIINF